MRAVEALAKSQEMLEGRYFIYGIRGAPGEHGGFTILLGCRGEAQMLCLFCFDLGEGGEVIDHSEHDHDHDLAAYAPELDAVGPEVEWEPLTPVEARTYFHADVLRFSLEGR